MLYPRYRLIGLEWIYSVFTMRTLYTLFALISLVLVALVATAAPPNRVPSLNVTCDVYNLDGNCSINTQIPPTFSGSGLNNKGWAVVGEAITGGGQPFSDTLSSVDHHGNYSEPDSDGVPSAGTWKFTLWQLDKNGSLLTELTDTAQTLTFE